MRRPLLRRGAAMAGVLGIGWLVAAGVSVGRGSVPAGVVFLMIALLHGLALLRARGR